MAHLFHLSTHPIELADILSREDHTVTSGGVFKL